MATIIDSLLVTFGMDPRPYQKAAKEAEQQQKQFKDSVKKGGNEIADVLGEVGRQAAVLFLGFESIKGAISYFAGLNVATAELGRFAANTGESAHEVNAWSSAVELAGGSAKDAEGDLRGLSSSLFALKTTGDVSPMVLLLQRMGVVIYDAQGKTRKLTDIFKDLGTQLRRYNRADAFNFARQAGISESTFNLIRAEAGERERILQTAEANNAINEENTKQAAELQSEWRQIGQGIKASSTELLSAFMPAIKIVLTWVEYLMHAISSTVKVVAGLESRALAGLSKIANSRVGKLVRLGLPLQLGGNPAELAEGLMGKPTSTQPAIRNNNPGNIRYAGQASATGADARGFAIFPTLAAGVQEANRQLTLYAKRGFNTIDSIVSKWAPPNENNSEAYKQRIEKALGIGRGEQLTAADRQRLLAAIFSQGEGNRVSLGTVSAALASPNALASAQFAGNAAMPAGSAAAQTANNETNVDISAINIYTQATDARGIAAELPNALRRKGIVAQADMGQS